MLPFLMDLHFHECTDVNRIDSLAYPIRPFFSGSVNSYKIGVLTKMVELILILADYMIHNISDNDQS